MQGCEATACTWFGSIRPEANGLRTSSHLSLQMLGTSNKGDGSPGSDAEYGS